MSDPSDLRGVLARLCRCAPEEIRGDFSLDVPALRGSMKKAVLIASLRRYLGVDCMEAAQAKTFAELEAMVMGKSKPVAMPATTASRAQPQVAIPVSLPRIPRSGCGIDLESVAKLPETADYAGHPFYKDYFSADEISYCSRQANPRAHFAARWCAKEALRKCDAAFLKVPLSEVELVLAESGGNFLRWQGRPLSHSVSVTHTDDAAAAVVLAPPGWSWICVAAAAGSVIAVALAVAAFFAVR
jgi:phosphopantetheine--protein transferase-like protein